MSTRAVSLIQDLTKRKQLSRRAQLLAAASVFYNLFKAGIAITAGLVAGSPWWDSDWTRCRGQQWPDHLVAVPPPNAGVARTANFATDGAVVLRARRIRGVRIGACPPRRPRS